MNIVEVIPLSRGITKETLDYFSTQDFPIGSVATIPVRSSNKPGLVISCESAIEQKAQIKSADFSLKKITAKKATPLFRTEFIQTARDFAQNHAISTGAVLHELTPSAIVSDPPNIPSIKNQSNIKEKDGVTTKIDAPQPALLQIDFNARIDRYKSLIRRHHKDNQSVIITCPTKTLTKRVANTLDGVKGVVFCLYSGRTKQKLRDEWNEICEKTADGESVVVVCTAQYLCLPIANLGLIIVESEADSSYTTVGRPHINRRNFAEALARTYGIECVVGDAVARIETIWRYRQDELSDRFSPVFRYLDPPTEIIDMKQHKAGDATDAVQIFSPAAAQLIRRAEEPGFQVLLFVARKGRRPFTVCNDCGEVLRSPESGYPLVLYERKGQRVFVDHVTNTEFTALRTCNNCNSWRLRALGIGIDFVAEVLRDNVPEIKLWQVDSETTSTQTQARKEVDKFEQEKSGLLLTTELGLRHLEGSVDASVIVTADSLLAVPDLGMDHKVFSLITELRQRSREKVIIQSRTKSSATLEHAAAGNVTAFYREQIAIRKRFGYPPFSVLIKISIDKPHIQARTERGKLRNMFSEYDPDIYPAFRSSQKSTQTTHALISIPHEQWPHQKLLEKLLSLPPAYDVNVNPDSLL